MGTSAAPPTEDPTGQLLEHVQELEEALDSADDSATRELAQELVSCIVQLYGTGLERVFSALLADGGHGRSIAEDLADDQLVATLLLIHDLHPVPLADRVQGA